MIPLSCFITQNREEGAEPINCISILTGAQYSNPFIASMFSYKKISISFISFVWYGSNNKWATHTLLAPYLTSPLYVYFSLSFLCVHLVCIWCQCFSTIVPRNVKVFFVSFFIIVLLVFSSPFLKCFEVWKMFREPWKVKKHFSLA